MLIRVNMVVTVTWSWWNEQKTMEHFHDQYLLSSRESQWWPRIFPQRCFRTEGILLAQGIIWHTGNGTCVDHMQGECPTGYTFALCQKDDVFIPQTLESIGSSDNAATSPNVHLSLSKCEPFLQASNAVLCSLAYSWGICRNSQGDI